MVADLKFLSDEYADHGQPVARHGFRLAFVVSLLIHITMGGLAAAVALKQPKMPDTIVIDLTSMALPRNQTDTKSHAPAVQNQRPRSASEGRSLGMTSSAVMAPASSPAAVIPQALASPRQSESSPAPVQSAAVVASAGQTVAPAGQGTAAHQSAIPGNRASGAPGGSGGTGTKSENSESLQQHYLKEHFTYIRDLIGRELRYPRQAIRMGWSGRVTVSFLVEVDGGVSEIRVARSSGCSLLDDNALLTVRRAAPFPRPPVSARLVIPVDYILE